MNLQKKEILLGLFFIIFVVSFFSATQQVSAVGQVLVCAEKTIDGKWCVNVPANQVNTAFRQAPSNCESTSFCKTGTCVDSQQGECRPNVPQRVCQASNGVWVQGKPEDIQQCQLGCCLVGDQASFVTQTGCKSIASQYGVETNFNSQIRNFDQCIALSNPRAKGACVIDDGFQRDCKNIAKSECNALESSSSGNRTVTFTEGLLCTAESLATRCAPTQKTTCVEGKFGVYFLDSCGNTANIYDASKVKDKEYWTNLKDSSDSTTCGSDSNNGNAGSAVCGNCDYLAGSVCKPYQRGSAQTPNQPKYGDFLCADLSCTYKAKTYLHGEEWCASDSPGITNSSPGSEYYKLTCYNGEVTQTQCDSFRQSVCVQNNSNADFKTAACVTNTWRDCASQKNKKDCENTDVRDCDWVVGETLAMHADSDGASLGVDSEGNLVPNTKGGNSTGNGAACLPRYPPGFLFWSAQNVTQEQQSLAAETEFACAVASEDCIVKFARQSVLQKWVCVQNCDCVESSWVKNKTNQCLALGDCGVKANYIGQRGESYDAISLIGNAEKNFPGYSQTQLDGLKKVAWSIRTAQQR